MQLEEVVAESVIETVFEWIIPLVSLALLGLVTVVTVLSVTDPLLIGLDLLLPVLFVTLIVIHGRKLQASDLDGGDRRRVAGWYALGTYTMLGLGGWLILLGMLGQSDVPTGVVLVTVLVAGGFLGLLVGTAQVRARQNAQEATEATLEQEFLERQQETNEVLNRILRHHLLNSLTVIRGQAQLLDDEVGTEAGDHVDLLRAQATEMTETIEEIRTITHTLTEDPDLFPVDVESVLASQLTCARTNYPHATVERRGPEPVDTAVAGNDLLGRALANVLNNAVEHNTAAEPHVEVSVTEREESVVVSVADNGSGIPAEQRDAVFAASERGVESDGEGLGLFLTAAVVRQYGGDVWLGDGELSGAAVCLELPKA